MLIHQQIRHQIAQQLAKLQLGVPIWQGHPSYLDLDQEPLVLAVFIDESQTDNWALEGGEWQAVLNIAIYQKSAVGESPLDELAEKIHRQLYQAFEQEELACLNDMQLAQYQYDQDSQKRTWYIANIQYHIHY